MNTIHVCIKSRNIMQKCQSEVSCGSTRCSPRKQRHRRVSSNDSTSSALNNFTIHSSPIYQKQPYFTRRSPQCPSTTVKRSHQHVPSKPNTSILTPMIPSPYPTLPYHRSSHWWNPGWTHHPVIRTNLLMLNWSSGAESSYIIFMERFLFLL